MADQPKAGIYLLIEFDWPEPFTQEHAKMARRLHDAVQNQHWIREAVAASHGFGSGPSSIWVFWLENYAALDQLTTGDNPVSAAYNAFFEAMPRAEQKIRQEVLFL